MVKESKYCSHAMKTQFDRELVMNDKDDKFFERSTKCWICNTTLIKRDVKMLNTEIVILLLV